MDDSQENFISEPDDVLDPEDYQDPNDFEIDMGSVTDSIILTEEQQEALVRIQSWFRGKEKQIYCLGGYAGTGKTTIMKFVLRELHCRFAACAFTGKAASVLRKKGVHASTIHSLIYEVSEDPKTHELVFIKRHELPYDLIVIDEASMVSKDLYEDLKSFDIPMLCVGDPGQLPPVGDNPGLMDRPDYVLQTIHRQALESPIIRLSEYIRTKKYMPVYDKAFDCGEDLIFRDKKIKTDVFVEFDQIICATNKTRAILNGAARKKFGYDGPLCEGEKVICVKNNRRFGVFNGQIFWIEELKFNPTGNADVILKDELDKRYLLTIWMEPFVLGSDFDPKVKYCQPHMCHFDYGYAITCHKSQGSEWDHVLVYDEVMPPKVWDMAKWRYTAYTRASKKLTICIDNFQGGPVR